MLFADEGLTRPVIRLAGEFTEAGLMGDTRIRAGAAITLACLACFARDNSLTGLEFAHGIPGCLGGAAFMNAGAYGGEIKDAVVSAEFVSPSGETGTTTKENMNLGYRTSCFKTDSNIITKVTFKLVKGDKTEIWDKMNTLMGKRRDKQPLEYPSAGSTFKRPEGYFAGALIEENGLKGIGVGGAEVSEKHAGFVINKSNATTKDILDLMKKVQDKVLENNGVKLEPEVIFVGREQ